MYQSLKIAWLFYRFTRISNSVITAMCMVIIATNGCTTVSALFWFKLGVFCLFAAHTEQSKKGEMYFFRNMGYARWPLWGAALLMDLTIFSIALTILAYVL